MTHGEIKKEIAQLIQFERQNDKRFLIVLKEAEDSRAYQSPPRREESKRFVS